MCGDCQGMDAAALKPLEAALAEWVKDYPAHVKARAAGEGLGGRGPRRDAARAGVGGLEEQVRPVTNFVQACPYLDPVPEGQRRVT